MLIFEQSGFAQVSGQLDISGYFTGLRNVLIQDKFRPLHLRYLAYDNFNNNFKLLLDKGDTKDLKEASLKQSTGELLKYFFTGIALPNSSFWVNLRPDSPDNIIDDYLAQTDVGKILLEADLQLKKDTAAFTSPQTPEGKKYWDSLYKKAGELFGSENITIPTLTRPWIVPGEIIIRETQENAYVYKATLKVMLEQDYLKGSATYNFSDERSKQLNEYASELIRKAIIPKLTKDINTAKRYAPLRQVYYSLILAHWFKQKFSGKSGLYSRLIDKNNLNGLISKESWSKDTYFQAYQKSFKEGEYNIREQVYTLQGQTIRNYMSGGIAIGGADIGRGIELGMVITNVGNSSPIVALDHQIAAQLSPAGTQPYSGELSIQPFTEKPVESTSSPVENQSTKPIIFADSIPASARVELVCMLSDPLFFPELTQGSIARVQVQAGQPGGISIVYRLNMLGAEGQPVMPDTALKIYESDVRLRAVFARIFEQTAKQLQGFDPELSPQDVQIYIGKHPQTQQPFVGVRSRYIDGEQLSRLLDQPGMWLEPRYHRGQLIVQGLAAYLRMHFGLGIIPADATASQLTLERTTGRIRFHDLDIKTVQLTPSEVHANLFYAWVMHEQLVNEEEFNRAFPVAVEQVYGNQAPEFLSQAGITKNPPDTASSPAQDWVDFKTELSNIIGETDFREAMFLRVEALYPSYIHPVESEAIIKGRLIVNILYESLYAPWATMGGLTYGLTHGALFWSAQREQRLVTGLQARLGISESDAKTLIKDFRLDYNNLQWATELNRLNRDDIIKAVGQLMGVRVKYRDFMQLYQERLVKSSASSPVNLGAGKQMEATLSEIIRGLSDSRPEIKIDSLDALFSIPKAVIPQSTFTIGRIELLSRQGEEDLRNAIAQGQVIILTDTYNERGKKVIEGNVQLREALQKAGIFESTLSREPGLSLVPMREANPWRDDSGLHGRAFYPNFIEGIWNLVWKGVGVESLQEGLNFSVLQRSEYNYINGGMTEEEVIKDVRAAELLQGQIVKIHQINSTIPVDLFFRASFQVRPLFLNIYGEKESLVAEGFKQIGRGKDKFSGIFLIPIEGIAGYLSKFGGLKTEEKLAWNKASEQMRLFAYASAAPWRLDQISLHLDVLQRLVGVQNHNDLLKAMVRRYALMAAVIHKEMGAVASTEAILSGSKNSSMFSRTNIGYSIFDYAALKNRDQFIADALRNIPELDIAGRQSAREKALSNFEMIKAEELDILRTETLRGLVLNILLDDFSEQRVIEAQEYFDKVYQEGVVNKSGASSPVVAVKSYDPQQLNIFSGEFNRFTNITAKNIVERLAGIIELRKDDSFRHVVTQLLKIKQDLMNPDEAWKIQYPSNCQLTSVKAVRVVARYHFSVELGEVKFPKEQYPELSIDKHMFAKTKLRGKEFIVDISADQFEPLGDNRFADLGVVVIPLEVVNAHPERFWMYTGNKQQASSPSTMRKPSVSSPVVDTQMIKALKKIDGLEVKKDGETYKFEVHNRDNENWDRVVVLKNARGEEIGFFELSTKSVGYLNAQFIRITNELYLSRGFARLILDEVRKVFPDAKTITTEIASKESLKELKDGKSFSSIGIVRLFESAGWEFVEGGYYDGIGEFHRAPFGDIMFEDKQKGEAGSVVAVFKAKGIQPNLPGFADEEKSSSPVGGIDFRSLPATAQRLFNSPPGNLPITMPLDSINLDESLRQIQNMLKAGIIPSSERIREYLQFCCGKKNAGQDIDKILACIAGILRLQEEQVVSTDLSLKEILALLESDRPVNEMQLVLAKIVVSEKEAFAIKPQ